MAGKRGWVILYFGYALLDVVVLSPHAWAEAGVGLFVAGLAAALTWSAGAAGFRFRPELRWSRHLFALPGQVALDAALLLRGIGRGILPHRRVPGKFRVLPFRAGSSGASDTERRALVTALGSLAPNTYVIHIDRERDRLLVHQLVARKKQFAAADPKWPV